MTVKDFLLSFKFEKLCEYYYRNKILKDVVLVKKAKQNKVNLKERNKALLFKLITQIIEIEVEKTPNEYLMVMQYSDYDYTDDLEMFRTKGYDVTILDKSECKKLPRFQKVTTLDEAHKNPTPWSSYSLLFVPWEEILGLEIAYLPQSKYAAAAAIIDELTFFGYDKEESDARVQEETAELERISEEIDNGTAEFVEYDSDSFRKELGLPEESEEKKARDDKLSRQIMVDNINEDYRVYNLLLKQGFFDDCEKK